jgi:hypothetical protein
MDQDISALKETGRFGATSEGVIRADAPPEPRKQASTKPKTQKAIQKRQETLILPLLGDW